MNNVADVTNEQVDMVRASLTRCLNQPAFLNRFYELFLGGDPAIAAMFKHTDMKRQQFMLAASLKTMALFGRMSDGSEPESMQKLAKRHDRHDRNIPPHYYRVWLDALLASVSEFDPEFKPGMATAWRAVMQKGIDYMVSKY